MNAAFVRNRLSPQGFLGLHLTIGVLILIGMAWLFGAIAEDVVTDDQLTIIDQRIAASLHAHATPALTKAMLFISSFGAPSTIIGIALAVGLFLWWQRRRYRLLALVLAVPCGMLLNVLIKYAVHRHRPIFDNPFLKLTSYSFPSGHAMGATVLYGVLAAFAVWTVTAWRWRLLAAFVAGLLIALVCFSRIYLGVHYLSDVLGGVTEGVAWLALCLTSVDTLRRQRIMNHSAR